jgi:hypothetical protein
MSMRNSNDTIGNRTRNLPACSAVPQPAVPPRAPNQRMYVGQIFCVSAEAFDIVDHEISLAKLQLYGTEETATK